MQKSVTLFFVVCVIEASSAASSFRVGRAVHEIYLSDPLDCLSQVICGLNTYPPQIPSGKSTAANDYAFLLQHVILRLKKQRVNETTTPIPILNEESFDDESDEEQDDDYEIDSDEDTTAERTKKKLLKNSKDQVGDIVEMKGLYPPFGLIDYRRESRAMHNKIQTKKSKGKLRNGKKSKKTKNKKKLTPPKTLTQIQELQREQDIRTKLRSGAKCLYGILEHTCPFTYGELLILMSGILERQKVISYSTNKILPMVGYLLKSRSLTQTLKSTFFALERLNNITIARDKNKEPISFDYIYDEIVRGEHGGNGLHIVETKNDAVASSNVWEDDEFDAALANPFLPKEKIPGYAIKDRSKKKRNKDEKEESGEDIIGDIAGFPVGPHPQQSDSDEIQSDEEVSREDVPIPPVFGGFHDKVLNLFN